MALDSLFEAPLPDPTQHPKIRQKPPETEQVGGGSGWGGGGVVREKAITRLLLNMNINVLLVIFGKAFALKIGLRLGKLSILQCHKTSLNPHTYFAVLLVAQPHFARAVPADSLPNRCHTDCFQATLFAVCPQKTLWPLSTPLIGNTHGMAKADKLNRLLIWSIFFSPSM